MKRGWQRLIVLGLLLIGFAQLLNAATHLSATIDEGFHITSGYEYLRTGRLRLFDEHTPVAKALFAWPLFFAPDLAPPEQADGYAEGNLITAAQATVLAYRPLDRVMVACRIPVTLLTLLLAAAVYRWAANLGGRRAGLLALALFVFDPNLLAHGSLATTDMGATAFVFWATLAVAEYIRRPGRLRWWQAALLLGLAQGAKLTALMLLPVNGILMLLAPDFDPQPKPTLAKRLLRRAISYAGMVAVAALILWALYGFEVRPLPQIAGGALPIPAASHVERWLRLQDNLAGGRESFLLGQNGTHGWWTYFPVAFALKTPLPTLILLLAAFAQELVRIRGSVKKRASEQADQRISGKGIDELRITNYVSRFTVHVSGFISKIQNPKSKILSLLLFPALYAAASLVSTFNIGYRHLLPVLPFLYVGVGQLASQESRIKNQESRIKNPQINKSHFILLGFLLWQMAGTLLIGPHYLTYFNSLVGKNDGWRYLADSNTDWGQGYKALAQYQEVQQIETVALAGFVFYDPAVYGVTYTALAPLPIATTPAIFPSRFAPPAGDYAISESALDGIPLADPEMYDWFRWRAPDAVIANAFHVYHVTSAETDVAWVAQCNTPTIPLDAAEIAAGFGRNDLRQIAFDCTQAWLVPGGAAEPGVYALHGALLKDTLSARLHHTQPVILDSFVSQNLTATRLIYRQRAYRQVPAFALYRLTAGSLTLPDNPVWPAPAGAPLATLMQQPAQQGAPSLEGSLRFLGVTVQSTDAGLNVQTWWQVTGSPAGRPLSIMAHLLNADGTPVAGADGLGVPPEVWQVDDILIQRHSFEVPKASPETPYILRTGVYWLDDGARWKIISASGDADALFVPLSPTRP